MNEDMARAYQILSTFSDKEVKDFIMMFGKKKTVPAETAEERKARKRAAADRIIARRPTLPPDFNEKRELLSYLDERYGV